MKYIDKIHPNIRSLIDPSINLDQDEVGLVREINSDHYGPLKYRVCGIIDIIESEKLNLMDKIHPMHQYCAYSAKAWGFQTEIGFLETHLVVGFCLESDNNMWVTEGKFFDAMKAIYPTKKKFKLPICMTDKWYAKWVKLAEQCSLDVYRMRNEV